MCYHQVVRRKDETCATHTLQDLKQLIERIQKMHHSSNNNDKHSASLIQYLHILNDPFITQTQNHISSMEGIVDDPSLYNDNDISSPVNALSPTMPIITGTPAIATTATTATYENRKCQHPSKERIFVERFYQQLLHELSSLLV